MARAFASSPLRFLQPRNHGDGAWVFSTTFGGGMVDGDRVDVELTAAAGALAFLGTQSATKVYRSPAGCVHRLGARVEEGAALAVVPDPVVCFAGARYAQRVAIDLAPDASLVLLDGYTCGRAARGERWDFDVLESRSTVVRAGGARTLADATLLDRAHGSIADRMGRFGAMGTLIAVGPRFAPVREAMLATHGRGAAAVAAASAIDDDAVVLRVAADRFESASRVLRPSFAALARVLGDDPFARKW